MRTDETSITVTFSAGLGLERELATGGPPPIVGPPILIPLSSSDERLTSPVTSTRCPCWRLISSVTGFLLARWNDRAPTYGPLSTSVSRLSTVFRTRPFRHPTTVSS